MLRFESNKIKIYAGLILLAGFFASCSTSGEGNGGANYSNLAQYAALSSQLDSGNVIACSASAPDDSNLVYTFFYPEPGSYDAKYFETDSWVNDDRDYSLYKEVDLEMEDVFNGHLKRFVKNGSPETWSIVTFLSLDTYSQSNPIRFKHQGKATEWIDSVQIDMSDKFHPTFSWEDGRIKENVIYFQVISDAGGNFLSGTYTTDKSFTYQDFSNVVFDVNVENPSDLISGENYQFTLMGVSIDNWVNLVIQKDFSIP